MESVKALIPYADSLPVHWVWFYILLQITFLLHILTMNFMLGGSLITFFERLKGGHPQKESKLTPILIALAVNLGVPPLLFVQVLYGQFFYSSSVLMAIYWISVIPILILAYYSAYIVAFKGKDNPGLAKLFNGISALFLLVIAFFFVNNMTLMLNPQNWSAYFDHPDGSLLNLSDPVIYPRFLHFVIGSVAIAYLGRVVFYKVLDVRPSSDHSEMISKSLKSFALFTILNIVVGIWFLIAQPKEIMMLFMGGNILYTLLLVVGILLTLALLHFAYKGKSTAVLGGTVALLLLMILQRDFVRSATLGQYFSLDDLEVVSQSSPLIAFLIVFILGLGLIFIMLKQAFGVKGGQES